MCDREPLERLPFCFSFSTALHRLKAINNETFFFQFWKCFIDWLPGGRKIKKVKVEACQENVQSYPKHPYLRVSPDLRSAHLPENDAVGLTLETSKMALKERCRMLHTSAKALEHTSFFFNYHYYQALFVSAYVLLGLWTERTNSLCRQVAAQFCIFFLACLVVTLKLYL